MIHEPTHIAPPTGTYRVLVWSGAKVEELAERPETEEGRAAALALFNTARFPAAFCHGPTVVKRNGRGDAHSAAFRAYLGAAPAPSTPAPRRPAPAKPTRPVEMPAREPTRPIEEPADPRELARAAANHPAFSDSSRAAPAVTTRPVEPAAAPVSPTTAKPAEEPMPAKTEAAPSCAKCSRYPVALTTAKTHAGTEQWCAHCRRVDAMRRNGTAFGRHAKAPKKAAPAKAPAKTRAAATAPTPKPAPPVAAPTATLADGLARVQRHAAAVARLGGIEAAEQLAGLVADAGGAAVVVEALTTLRGIA